ncbi:MAG: hypothetical protein ABID87_02215 [Chloroflexota bacterium]
MSENQEERLRQAARNTEVLRLPRQTLATFGTTSVYYYLVTEAVYSEVVTDGNAETVVREGRITAERPKIVTPYYLSRLEGFTAEADRYLKALLRELGPDTPGIFYSYRNDAIDLNIVAEDWRAVASRIIEDIDRRGEPLATVIKGQDDLWDVSLMKFIFELTRSSVQDNLSQMGARGLLKVDRQGVPREARNRIEELFWQVKNGERDPGELKKELDRWDVFSEYQDRFLALFRRRKS